MLRRRHIQIADTDVVVQRPVRSGVLCLLSAGIWGAVCHRAINRDAARLGRLRGAMPFAFITVLPAVTALAWLIGICGWAGALYAVWVYVGYVRDGLEPTSSDITRFASIGLLLVPLWLTALHTGRRLHTAQHLTGVSSGIVNPMRAAVASVVFPPLGTWYLLRAANRAWGPWR